MCHNFAKQAEYEKVVSASREKMPHHLLITKKKVVMALPWTYCMKQRTFHRSSQASISNELKFEKDDYLDDVLSDVDGKVDVDMNQPSVEISGENNVIGDQRFVNVTSDSVMDIDETAIRG
ncbi:hypothetical protein DPMN_006692 [Dreissena polymorpha]|uniref:Uncharacterized protein n=1 Tax=Dreissena polymorpha TaxID=45954 RepID=A0A9D4MX09_DREPO|nr:hypothetical protein DPMN_006692 [Dreissena polymorpha]